MSIEMKGRKNRIRFLLVVIYPVLVHGEKRLQIKNSRMRCRASGTGPLAPLNSLKNAAMHKKFVKNSFSDHFNCMSFISSEYTDQMTV